MPHAASGPCPPTLSHALAIPTSCPRALRLREEVACKTSWDFWAKALPERTRAAALTGRSLRRRRRPARFLFARRRRRRRDRGACRGSRRGRGRAPRAPRRRHRLGRRRLARRADPHQQPRHRCRAGDLGDAVGRPQVRRPRARPRSRHRPCGAARGDGRDVADGAARQLQERAPGPDRHRDRQPFGLSVDGDGRHRLRGRPLAAGPERPAHRRRDPDRCRAQSRQLGRPARRARPPRSSASTPP